VSKKNKKNKKKGKVKKKPFEIPPENINPKDFETRFGALAPWGGACLGGASIRYTDDGAEIVGDEDEETLRYN
jgi:hypothetical protein